jgi:hypothetical protein
LVVDPPLAFPVRDVPGGCRGIWDDLDDHFPLRARAEATDSRRLERAEVTGQRWQWVIVEERFVSDWKRKRHGRISK